LCAFKEIGILALGTLKIWRLLANSLKTDQGLSKSGRGADDSEAEVETNIMDLNWYDNKPVYLVSSYKGRDPVETVKCWSVAERQHVVSKTSNCEIVHLPRGRG
jgi:hypothetical protein